MRSLRQKLIPSLVLHFFLVGLLCLGIFLGVNFLQDNSLIAASASLFGFFLGSSLLLWHTIHRPLHRIIYEMKALLTGHSYRRIFTKKQNEIGVLAHFFNEVTRNLENISGDFASHKRLQKEVNVAQAIQRDLIPTQAPTIQGLDVTAKTRPASEIGGDTFDFYVQEHRTLMYIGDSTGHGVPAGIVMIMVDTLLKTFIDLYPKLTDVIIQLNKYLKPHLKTTMFMTMLFVEWQPSQGSLKWIGAGHEHLIHVQSATGQVQAIQAGGIAVGMVPDNSALIKEQELQLNSNDFLILYSDGITEAKNIKGEIYSLKRLTQFIQNQISPDLNSEQLFQKIASDVGRFMEGHVQEDDMTLIVIKRTDIQNNTPEPSTDWSEENPNPEENEAAISAPSSAAPA